jgi:glycerophosphoryl diester phosphodiesterase
MMNLAHRGFSAEFPENTLLAFEEGLSAGADGFECDLRLTSDGTVVIFHDDNLKRLCRVKGSVEKSRLSDLKKLKVKNSEPIPTLEEVLTRFHTTRINLELKESERPADLVEETLKILTKVRPVGPILFSSFSLEILEILSTMDPERKLGKLGVLVDTENIGRLPETLETLKPDTWNLPRQILTQPWAMRWRHLKIPPVWVWTLDEPDQWDMAFSSRLPVEAIITNRPAGLRAFLDFQRLA